MKWEKICRGKYQGNAGYLVSRSYVQSRKWVWRSSRMTDWRGYHRTMRLAMAAAEEHHRDAKGATP